MITTIFMVIFALPKKIYKGLKTAFEFLFIPKKKKTASKLRPKKN